jgi:hypothetical protein
MDCLILSCLNDIIDIVLSPPATVIDPLAAVQEQIAPVHEPTASTSASASSSANASDSYPPAVGTYYIYEVISKVDSYEFYTCR